MHEASLVQGLLKVALKAVDDHNAAHPGQRIRRIRSITCELGLISCVEPRTLTGCFEILAQGGMAEGAELILRTAPLPCRCADCGHAFELHRRHFVCPHCGSDAIRFTGGHGLVMTGLEVEPEESHD